MKKRMCLAVAVLAAGIGFADTLTWTGGTGNNWNEPANWTSSGSHTVPESGDTLVFPNAAKADYGTVNDIDGLTLAKISFTGAGGTVSVSGAAFALDRQTYGTDYAVYVTKGGNVTINNDIELAEGDQNFYSQDLTTFTLNGVISGAGKLVKDGASSQTSYKDYAMILNGVNTYAGGTQINYGIVHAMNAHACGDTTKEIYFNVTWPSNNNSTMFCTLRIGTTDPFPYPIRTKDTSVTSPWAANTYIDHHIDGLVDEITLTGPITGGHLDVNAYKTYASSDTSSRHKVKFEGPVTTKGMKLYGDGDAGAFHFKNAVTNTDATVAATSYSSKPFFYFYSPANEFNGTQLGSGNCVIHAMAANVLHGAVLWTGDEASKDKSSYVYLNGYDQTIDRVVGTRQANTKTDNHFVDGGSKSAMLTMEGTKDQTNCLCVFNSNLSLVWNPTNDFTFACTGVRPSTMTGTITVKGGTFRTEAGHTFKNVTNLVVTAGTLAIANTTGSAFTGVKAVSLGATARLDLTAAVAPFPSSVIDVDIAEGGKIVLAADETALNLKSVVYANHGMGVGYYTGADGVEGAQKVDWIEGSGKLYVASSTVGVEPAGWQGPEGSEGTSIGTAANWDFAGAVERMNDYSLVATFAAAGTTATVDRAVNWAGIRFETPNADSFTLLKGNDGANVALGGRGIEAAARGAAGVYRIEAPVTIAAPQTWTLGDKTTLDVAGGLMNADVPGVQSITRPMGGKLILRGNETSTYTGDLHLHGLVDVYGDDPFGPGAEDGGRVYFYGGDNPTQNKDYITFCGNVTVTKPFTLYGNWQNNPIRFAGSSQTVTFEDEVSWGGRCLMGAACNIVFNGGGTVSTMPIYSTQGGTVGKIIFAGKPYTIDFESSETRYVHIHFNVASNKVNWLKGYYAQHYHFGVDWALYEGNTKVYLQYNTNYGTSSLDLCGHSQRADYAAGNSLKCWFTNSAEAATMYMDGRTSITNLTEFRGPFNLSKAGASLYAMGSATTCVTNTSTGFLEVKGGTMAFRAGSSWAGTDVRIDASADANDAVLSLGDGNALARKAELTMTDGTTKKAKLELAAGTVQKVRTLTINGQMLYGGTTYGSSQSDAAVKDDVHFSGTGVLYVSHPSGTLLLIR